MNFNQVISHFVQKFICEIVVHTQWMYCQWCIQYIKGSPSWRSFDHISLISFDVHFISVQTFLINHCLHLAAPVQEEWVPCRLVGGYDVTLTNPRNGKVGVLVWKFQVTISRIPSNQGCSSGPSGPLSSIYSKHVWHFIVRTYWIQFFNCTYFPLSIDSSIHFVVFRKRVRMFGGFLA